MRSRRIIAIAIAAVLALAASFFWGGDTAEKADTDYASDEILTATAPAAEIDLQEPEVANSPEPDFPPSAAETADDTPSENRVDVPAPAADEENADVAASGDFPAEESTIQGTACTISVRCDAVLGRMDMLAPGKAEIVPRDGIILSRRQVSFSEGESVFDVLLREMRDNKIHFEFVSTPMYNSVYIEGIGNLYEFDCGEYSGWLYRVNGTQPTYGCSQYKVKAGDEIEFIYSCDLLGGGE